MQVEIKYSPSYSLAICTLEDKDKIVTEAGAMVSMSKGMQMETKARGGMLKSLGRSVLTGESFFQNTYVSPPGGGEITLAPDLPGDIVFLELDNDKFYIQSGSFLACDDEITLNSKFSGKSLFAGEGLTVIEAVGSGKLLLSSFGAIFKKELGAGEKYIVDTQHIVAWSDGMGFETKAVGGVKSTLFSKEGFVVELTGPGVVFGQTRSPRAFIQWIGSKMTTSSGNGSNNAGIKLNF